jgi:hypothetical protein
MWRFINHAGCTLWNVGTFPDGSLHNPNGYPEELVRAAIAGAKARRHERRSAAARKSARTRARRREAKLGKIVSLAINGVPTGPSESCILCGKRLSDQVSIARGIGSECWQGVLVAIETHKGSQ